MKNKSDSRFKMLKKHHTKTLLEAIDNNLVDEPIVSFLKKIIEIPNLFTSSSCSGRIALLIGDEDENKLNTSFFKKDHETICFEELYESLTHLPKEGVLWLKVEPFIFHFGLKDYEDAKEFLDFCRNFGLKKAGIISAKEGKFVCEVTNTVYFSTIIAKDGELLIPKDYFRYLIEIANKKLEQNHERLEKFSKELLKKYLE